MDELGGEWTYSYGLKRRERASTIDVSTVAVRAGTEATRALTAASSRAATAAPSEAYRRVFAAHAEATSRIMHSPPRIRESRSFETLARFFETPFFARPWLFDRDAVKVARAVGALATELKGEGVEDAVRELIAALEALHADEPLAALRTAADGDWVRVPTSGVETSDSLRRTAGALALVEKGTDRLLTDSAFCLLAEEVAGEKLHRVLAEHGWALKSRLSVHPRAIVVQPSSRERAAFDVLRRAFTEVPSIFELLEPIFLEPIHGRWRPSDPRYPDQWQWNNDGRNGGTRGADVRAESAARGQREEPVLAVGR
jgi:hypothetical protein